MLSELKTIFVLLAFKWRKTTIEIEEKLIHGTVLDDAKDRLNFWLIKVFSVKMLHRYTVP